jgi:hypothetical protein
MAERPVERRVGARGQQRLEIAKRLMKWPDDADVMERIEALTVEEREHLRGLVDWVEEYERHEQQ